METLRVVEDEPAANDKSNWTTSPPKFEEGSTEMELCKNNSCLEFRVSRVTNSLESVGDSIEKSPTVDGDFLEDETEVYYDGVGESVHPVVGCAESANACVGQLQHQKENPYSRPVLENHITQHQQLVGHHHDRLDDVPDLQIPSPGNEHPCALGKANVDTEGSLETIPHSIKHGCGAKISQLESLFNTMHPKGQYNLFANVHSSTLLDALDLCRYNLPIVPLERLNSIPETNSLIILQNAIMGNQNSQLAILYDQMDVCDDDGVILTRPLAIRENVNMEMIPDPKGTELGVECITPINRIEKK